MGKKDGCAVFGCNNDRLFANKYIIIYWSSLFAWKVRVNTEQVPPVHPILGLQPRDKAAMLGIKQKNIYSKNLHENRV